MIILVGSLCKYPNKGGFIGKTNESLRYRQKFNKKLSIFTLE